jgi:hypothetical protein
MTCYYDKRLEMTFRGGVLSLLLQGSLSGQFGVRDM